MQRRDFIRIVVTGTLAGVACGRPRAFGENLSTAPEPDLSPETNTVCHAVRDGRGFTMPKPKRHVPIVVVGGGPSGLCAARALGDRPYLLIEKEPQVGGNATGGEWRGVGYSSGTSYNNNRDVKALAKELGVPLYELDSVDGIILEDRFVPDFLTTGLDKAPCPQAVRDGFRRFLDKYRKFDPDTDREHLDNQPFAEILKDYPKEMTDFFDAFGANSWGARVADTSAYVGIEAAQWMGGLEAERYAGAAGFGGLTTALGAAVAKGGAGRLLTGASVVRVQPDGNRVLIAYVPPGAVPAKAASVFEEPPLPVECVSADTVIVAAPKFIAKHLVAGLPADQKEAMGRIRYEPYMVANLCFDGVVHESCFDTNVPGSDVIADFVCADWPVRHGRGPADRPTVLSCYMPLRNEERAVLLDEAQVRARALLALDHIDRWFPGAKKRCREIRVRLRGHPMHASMCGMITRFGPLSQRSLGAIHFSGTDGAGGVSEFATALSSGRAAAAKAIASLDRAAAHRA
jgi:monoamine oxidase